MDTKEMIDLYSQSVDSLMRDINTLGDKVDSMKALSIEVEKHREGFHRNSVLDVRQKLAVMKSKMTSVEKVAKSCITWADNAILVRLQEEELDNYSRNGKLFYPSNQTYFSVSDRDVVDDFALKQGSLEIFGNTLNKQYVSMWVENSGELPAGISSYQKTRLNVRSK